MSVNFFKLSLHFTLCGLENVLRFCRVTFDIIRFNWSFINNFNFLLKESDSKPTFDIDITEMIQVNKLRLSLWVYKNCIIAEYWLFNDLTLVQLMILHPWLIKSISTPCNYSDKPNYSSDTWRSQMLTKLYCLLISVALSFRWALAPSAVQWVTFKSGICTICVETFSAVHK